MMKRFLLPAVALLSVGGVGCDRKTTSAFILTIGLNSQQGSPLADFGFESGPTSQPERESQLGEAAAALAALRQQSPSQPARVSELVERVRELERASDDTDDSAPLAEATLAALSIGARLQPELYRSEFEAAAQRMAGRGETDERQRRSTQRVLAALGSEPNLARHRDLVCLHAATYPECEMNADFLVTVAMQFADDNQVGQAIAVVQKGLRLCSKNSQASQLRETLQQIYIDNPGRPGVPMNFSGPDLEGQRFELKSLRGQPVLVTFWASWCSSCQRESAVIDRVAKRNGGLQVVGVCMDTSRRQLDAFLRTSNIKWKQVYTNQPGQTGWDNPIAKYYRVNSIPTTFLLDSEGKVVAADLRGEAAMNSAIAELRVTTDGEEYAAR